MNRKVLTEENINTIAQGKITEFHDDTVSEVIKTISENKVVVVGMRHNPTVKKARNLLNNKKLDFTYLEYGSYLSEWKKRLAIKLWSGWPTYPQVFIDGKLVGGHAELKSILK
jgi:glutaredoxin-related protein